MQTSKLNQEYLRDRYEYFMRGKHDGGNLYNEKTFYHYFIKDMMNAKKEVIIYSPFVSKFRTDYLKRTIVKLREKNIEVFIFTRPVDITTYDTIIHDQLQVALDRYEEMGVNVCYLSGYIHEKVAIIDREILWEGSLNILSQRASREMMRRTESESSAIEVIKHLGINRKIAESYKRRYEIMCQYLITNTRKNLKLKYIMFLLGLSIPISFILIFVCLRSDPIQQNLEILRSIIKLLFLTK